LSRRSLNIIQAALTTLRQEKPVRNALMRSNAQSACLRDDFTHALVEIERAIDARVVHDPSFFSEFHREGY